MFGVAYTSKIYSQVPKHEILQKKLLNLIIRVINTLVTVKRQYLKSTFPPRSQLGGSWAELITWQCSPEWGGSHAYPRILDLGENVSKRQTYSTYV